MLNVYGESTISKKTNLRNRLDFEKTKSILFSAEPANYIDERGSSYFHNYQQICMNDELTYSKNWKPKVNYLNKPMKVKNKKGIHYKNIISYKTIHFYFL